MKVIKSTNQQKLASEARAQQILDQASNETSNKSAISKSAREGTTSIENFDEDFETTPVSKKVAFNRDEQKTKPRFNRNRDHLGSDITDYRPKSENKDKLDVKETTDSEYKRLMHKAIHLLSMREHSIEELLQKLSSKSDSFDAIAAVMDFLTQHDYVSDLRFAEAFVRSRANKGQGPTKIKADLKAKGVDAVTIDEFIDPNAALWFDNAQALHSKKYGDEPVTDYNTWSKRARFLQSRGFTMEQIQATVPQVNYD